MNCFEEGWTSSKAFTSQYDEPHLYFMHFFGANDDAVTLAQGLRAALDQTDSAKSTTR